MTTERQKDQQWIEGLRAENVRAVGAGGCSPPVIVAGRSRLDEAVEVACRKWCGFTDTEFEDLPPAGRALCIDHMRAALLASLPVLLGEARPAILCVDSDRVALVDKHDEFPSASFKNVWVVDCYAPSLGEGE